MGDMMEVTGWRGRVQDGTGGGKDLVIRWCAHNT